MTIPIYPVAFVIGTQGEPGAIDVVREPEGGFVISELGGDFGSIALTLDQIRAVYEVAGHMAERAGS